MTANLDLVEIEAAILERCPSDEVSPGALFLLGAPRTGSTVIYQSCIAYFGLPYLSNLANDSFSKTPIIALTIQKALPITVRYASRFGKTEGAFQPSEGSAVMSHWFGGGHPSQTLSATILPDREPHFLQTLAASNALFGRPLAVKNAWNCFRVAYLAAALPHARFLWIRRDIADAAASDLEARVATKGSAQAWNSATPANWEKLRARPPIEQVVENQYEFNRSIGESLRAGAAGRWSAIWYEDFIATPVPALTHAGEAIGLRPIAVPGPLSPNALPPKRRLSHDEVAALHDYVGAQGGRLAPHRYAGRNQA